ncbi:MAG: glycosyltransferase family 39 protein [Candidatus Levybacteria bacterium]|nr:glycosyltransferase family 39 protein [Candidatus Levybacteria bacterium]
MNKIQYIFVIVIAVFALSFFYNKGFSAADEGYILHAAQRLHNGEIPYRDFNFIYTPGSLFAISATFSILGESILSGKLLVVIIAIITSLLFYLTANKLSNSKTISTLSVLAYLSWTPSHINFPFPVVFCIFTGVASLFTFLKILEKPKKLYYLALGLCVALTFFFKQNFGIALFMEYAILFFIYRQLRKKEIFLFFVSFFSGIFTFYLYLFFTKSINSFFSYSSYAFQEYFVKHSVIAPFPYDPSTPIASLLKMIVYLSPLLLSISVIIYSLHKKNKIQYTAAAAFVGFYYLVGIYPSTDYVHISPLLSLLGLLFAILLQTKNIKLVAIIYILFLITIIAGFYTALFKGFYKWDAPIIQQAYYLDHPRMKIWSSKNEFVNLISYIQGNTSKDDYIYFYLFEPIFYFASDRKNPIAYLDSFLPNEKLQAEYVYSIKNKNTKLIISGVSSDKWSNSYLSNYILTNYVPSATISGYTVWNKK